LTQSTHPFNPLLPSYSIGNLRVGARNEKYEISLYIKNVTDEHGLLALDRERGNRARVGFLTTPPRSIGVQFTANLGN
jgi:iron complex outermembrane receptor protein